MKFFLKLLLRIRYWYMLLSRQPIAKKLTPRYFHIRDQLIMKSIESIINGVNINSLQYDFNAKSFDERIIEYPYFVNWFLQGDYRIDHLDVGCVLNNQLLDNFFEKYLRELWFCNVVSEPIKVKIPTYYHKATLDTAFNNSRKFKSISCLSTIEHIGYDNSHYGSVDPPTYHEPNITPLLNSINRLVRITAPGGRLIISVPYGFREVQNHPNTGKGSSQIFSFNELDQALKLLQDVGLIAKLEVYELSNKGWIMTDPKLCIRRYGDGVPAAAAVAFLTAERA
jgi:hypothetical protein